MKIQRPKEIKVVDEEREDLLMELEVAKTQLANDEACLKGGVNTLTKKPVLAIDEEIRTTVRTIRIAEIKRDESIPVEPYYKFEVNKEYCDLIKEIKQEELDALNSVLARINKQKEQILVDIPASK